MLARDIHSREVACNHAENIVIRYGHVVESGDVDQCNRLPRQLECLAVFNLQRARLRCITDGQAGAAGQVDELGNGQYKAPGDCKMPHTVDFPDCEGPITLSEQVSGTRSGGRCLDIRNVDILRRSGHRRGSHPPLHCISEPSSLQTRGSLVRRLVHIVAAGPGRPGSLRHPTTRKVRHVCGLGQS